MGYLFFGLVALGVVGLFWLVGRLMTKTSQNDGTLHGNPSGGTRTD